MNITITTNKLQLTIIDGVKFVQTFKRKLGFYRRWLDVSHLYSFKTSIRMFFNKVNERVNLMLESNKFQSLAVLLMYSFERKA